MPEKTFTTITVEIDADGHKTLVYVNFYEPLTITREPNVKAVTETQSSVKFHLS